MHCEAKEAQESEFKLVTKKGKHSRRSRNIASKISRRSDQFDNTERSEVSHQNVITQLQRAESDLLQSVFFAECFKGIFPVLAGVERIICLGLGNFSECTIARYQLAFIRCLRTRASLATKVQFFDPVFSRVEVETLQTLGETVLTENLEGKYGADCRTFFYLPHCPKQIVNNLLWKNWHSSRLPNVVLLCNSFSNVVNNNPVRLLRNSGGYILRSVDSFQEVPLKNIFRFGDIFNDTSLHYLTDSEAIADGIGWDCNDEPSYGNDDLELITKDLVERLTFSSPEHSNGLEQNVEAAAV